MCDTPESGAMRLFHQYSFGMGISFILQRSAVPKVDLWVGMGFVLVHVLIAVCLCFTTFTPGSVSWRLFKWSDRLRRPVA